MVAHIVGLLLASAANQSPPPSSPSPAMPPVSVQCGCTQLRGVVNSLSYCVKTEGSETVCTGGMYSCPSDMTLCPIDPASIPPPPSPSPPSPTPPPGWHMPSPPPPYDGPMSPPPPLSPPPAPPLSTLFAQCGCTTRVGMAGKELLYCKKSTGHATECRGGQSRCDTHETPCSLVSITGTCRDKSTSKKCQRTLNKGKCSKRRKLALHKCVATCGNCAAMGHGQVG